LWIGVTLALVPSSTVLSTDEMGRIAPPIFTSVGSDAVNAPGDVFVIQSLLNDRLPKPHTPIEVTGVADPGFVLAIEAYQAVVMNMNPPSGHVDPGSATYYSLAARPLVNEAPAPTTHFGHVGIVPPEIADAAITSHQHWNVPASITLAQWVVESAWGAAMPPGSNNPFGIKATAQQDAVDSGTHEVVNGETITITARFRKFDSLADAFDQHGKLLATASPYTRAMKVTQDPDAFADALTGVYATDPNYGFTLKWVIKNYGFAQFDH
jgi:Mannosyl-glycoprotein endo-beta-N-acetylglucosaminidase